MHQELNTMLGLAHDKVGPDYAFSMFDALPSEVRKAMLATWFTGREVSSAPPKLVGYRVTPMAGHGDNLKKINAIKLVRGLGRLGLKEAKDTVEGANGGKFDVEGEYRDERGNVHSIEQVVAGFRLLGYLARPITE